MTAERWEQVKQIFEAAIELAPELRKIFLDGACGGDTPLRDEIESLIAHDRQAENFIEVPASDVAARLFNKANPQHRQGESIGFYTVLKLIGTGGMSAVYLAEDTRLKRHIALKILPEDASRDRDHIRRFRLEACAASALNHPNILTVYETGQTAQGYYIAAEYIEGENLRQRLENCAPDSDCSADYQKSSQIGLGEALDIAVQVAGALEAAHAAGIVHRDIKPENIMLRHDGYVKVLDFGLAKLVDWARSLSMFSLVETTPGILMGTVAYMSPEQARGYEVDEQTDIWSLGVVLYEMLTGKRPFSGPTPSDVIVAILERQPAPLNRNGIEIPERFQQIINGALAKDRAKRYQSVAALLVDLRQLKEQVGENTALKSRDNSSKDEKNLSISVSGNREDVENYRRPAPIEKTPRRLLFSSSRYIFNNIKQHFVGASIAALSLLIILLFVIVRPPTAEPGNRINSIAVLPFSHSSDESFVYLTKDYNTEYYSTEITNHLTNRLSEIKDLNVIGRGAVFSFNGKTTDRQEIARILGANALLTGDVKRNSRGDFSISAELIDAREEKQLWSKQYNPKAEDLVYISDVISQDVALILRPQMKLKERLHSTSAAGNFSAEFNPNGDWSYGSKPESDGTFTLLTGHDRIQVWSGPDGYPLVGTTPVAHTDELIQHPANNGNMSVVRWTSPSTGTYIIDGAFNARDIGGVDVFVLHNNIPLLSSSLDLYNVLAPFNYSLEINKGDFIDFAVGFGSDGNFSNDSTGLRVQITPTN